MFAGLEPQDVEILYETLAEQAIMASMVTDSSAVAKNLNNQPVKRDAASSTEWKAEFVRKARRELGIPMTEACLFTGEGRVMSTAEIAEFRKSDKFVKAKKLVCLPPICLSMFVCIRHRVMNYSKTIWSI